MWVYCRIKTVWVHTLTGICYMKLPCLPLSILFIEPVKRRGLFHCIITIRISAWVQAAGHNRPVIALSTVWIGHVFYCCAVRFYHLPNKNMQKNADEIMLKIIMNMAKHPTMLLSSVLISLSSSFISFNLFSSDIFSLRIWNVFSLHLFHYLTRPVTKGTHP